jgi:hypothetical protein
VTRRVPARGLGRRGERMVVVGALLTLLAAGLVGFSTSTAAVTDGRPDCGPGDANRNTITLVDGSTVRPCLSGATLKVYVKPTYSGLFGFEDSGKYFIDTIRVTSGTTSLKYVDGSTDTDLARIRFDSFSIYKDATLTGHNNGVQNQVTPLSSMPPYTVKLTPASNAVFGGDGVTTELWVTKSSWVDLVFLGACVHASVDTFVSLSWLLNGSSWNGCAMDLDVRYMITYVNGGSTTGKYPIQLPNTNLAVTQ